MKVLLKKDFDDKEKIINVKGIGEYAVNEQGDKIDPEDFDGSLLIEATQEEEVWLDLYGYRLWLDC